MWIDKTRCIQARNIPWYDLVIIFRTIKPKKPFNFVSSTFYSHGRTLPNGWSTRPWTTG